MDGRSPRRPALYRYRPLTARFIAARWERLRALESCEPAAAALGAGAAPYLRMSGLRGEQAEPALRAMLERLYEDATGFAFPEERFERAVRRGRADALRRAVRARVVAPLDGLRWSPIGSTWATGSRSCAATAATSRPRRCGRARRSGARRGPVRARARARARRAAPDRRGARSASAGSSPGCGCSSPGASRSARRGWTARRTSRWQPIELRRRRGRARRAVDPRRGRGGELREFLDALATRSPAGRWRGRCRASRWAARGRSTPRRCPTTCSRCARCSARRARPARRASRCGWPRCAPRRASAGVQRRVELALALERFVIGGARGRLPGARSAPGRRAAGARSSRSTCARCCAT